MGKTLADVLLRQRDQLLAKQAAPGVIFGISAGVAEWQTRRIQNPLPARACGFKSHLRHLKQQDSQTTVYELRGHTASDR